MARINLEVGGMHCKSCKMLVEDALKELGAKEIKIELDEKRKAGKVSCDFSDREKVVKAIEVEGYKVIR